MTVQLGGTTETVLPAIRDVRLRRLVPGVGSGLAMLVVGLIGATSAGLGWDEAATADMATRSVAQIWATIRNVDGVFGPYYVFMHFWTSVFGMSLFSLRAPSILAMAVAVGLAGELGRRLINPVVGLLGGLLLCLMPAISRYAQEARPYAICCLFSALATLLLFANLESTAARSRWAWAAYGTTVVLLGASHVIGLTILGGHAIVVLRNRAGGRWLGWLVAVGAALACLAPLLLLGSGQRDTQIPWVRPPGVHTLIASPGTLVGATATGFLLLGLALVATWRWIDLAALAVVPVLAVAAVSHLGLPVWVPRYLLIVLMPLALLAAAGAAGAAGVIGSTPRAGLVRLLVILLVLAGTAYDAQRAVRRIAGHAGGNYAQASQIIRRLDQPGDAIVFQSGRVTRTGIGYYLRNEPDRPADVLLSRTAAARDRLSAGEYPNPTPHLQNQSRVWLAVMSNVADPIAHKPTVGPVLNDDFVRTGIWHFSHTTLALYTHK
jgi:mannosyltransferase